MSRKGPIRGTVIGAARVVPLRDMDAGPITADPDDLQARAALILAEAEAARDAAVADGWRQGFEAGVAEGRQELDAALAAVLALQVQLTEVLDETPDRLAQDVAAIGLEVAARLARADIAANPERIVDVVKGAIRKATDRERLVAHVNPGDLDAMRAAREDLMAQMGGIHRLEVIEDPRIQAGGCVLETPSGDVDARLHVQLERLLEALAAPPDPTLLEPGA